MKAHKLPGLTIEEYLQQEIDAGIKYEYHSGEIYAMAGGTLNHGLLCGNAYSEIRNKLREKSSNCKPLTSEVKIHIKKKNSFVYPDAMVICGNIELSEDHNNSVTNPMLIVEVLSKSSAEYDRGDKFYLYRQIPGFREYVLIEQKKHVVDVHYKSPKSDLWQITRYEGLDQTIQLQSLGIEISMADLYFDIDLAGSE